MRKNPADRALRGPPARTAWSPCRLRCGSGDDRRRRQRSGGGRRRRTAHRRLRHPLSPVRAGEIGQLHRLRHRTDGSDRRKDRPRSRIPGHLVRNDLPRPRPRQVRSGDLGGDDHRRTRESGRLLQPVLPLRTGGRWSKKAARSSRSKNWKARPSPPSRARPGRNSPRKKSAAAKSAPTPKAPTRSTRSSPAPSTRDHRRAGRRRTRSKSPAESKSPKKCRPKKTYGIAVRQGEEELLDEINKGLKEVEEAGLQDDLRKVVPPGDRPSVFTATPRSELSRGRLSRQEGAP